jgi:soluble lytic murein transglycosylase-like protein
MIGTSMMVLALSWPVAAIAQTSPQGFDLSATISEAALRFGLPERWIRAVMGVESAYQPRAVSSAGAMGLMQVMPATYADLRGRYGLGADPFHPHDNVIAGAAYLREMFDRFGAPGFLAAYNAGPARYLQHVADGRPLPLETRAYVAKLTPAVQGEGAVSAGDPAPRPLALAPRPGLFVALSTHPKARIETVAPLVDAAHAPIFAALSGGGS